MQWKSSRLSQRFIGPWWREIPGIQTSWNTEATRSFTDDMLECSSFFVHLGDYIIRWCLMVFACPFQVSSILVPGRINKRTPQTRFCPRVGHHADGWWWLHSGVERRHFAYAPFCNDIHIYTRWQYCVLLKDISRQEHMKRDSSLWRRKISKLQGCVGIHICSGLQSHRLYATGPPYNTIDTMTSPSLLVQVTQIRYNSFNIIQL